MNDGFLLQIATYLDSKGIKTDYEKLKKMINADPMMAKLGIDSSASKQQVRDLANEIHKSLDGIFKNAGVDDFKISVKDVEGIINGTLKKAQQDEANRQKQITIEAEKTKKVYDDFNKNNISGIDLEIKQREEQAKLNSNQIKAQMLERVSAENKIQSEIKETAKIQKETANFNSGKIVLNNQISTYLRQNTKLSDDFKNRLVSVQQQLKSADKVQFNNLKNQFREITTEANAFGKSGKSGFDQLKTNMGQFLNFFYGAGAVVTAIGSVKQLISTVSELDKSIIDIQQATGYSQSQAKELLNTYIDLGQELGATGTEVAESANNWLRQGKSISDTNTLIKDSMVLSKDAQIESADATTYLTTAAKGYGVATNNVIGIVDKLTSVDMKSATSAGGLAQAMAATATNANMAGVSMDKLLGYLAVVGETTGEAMSSVGTGFSTMFSRMGNIKLSRLVDPETGEDLSNVETSLHSVGIELRSDDKTFRNFGDVLDDVAGKWSGYSSVTQRSIASSIAGKNHMEQFLVLMNNYSTATDYMTVATNSSGTAMEKFSNYEEGVEAKTKILQASLQELATDTLNSQLIKSFLDLSNNAVILADNMGLFNTVLGVAGVVAIVKFYQSLDILKLKSLEASGMLVGLTESEIANASSTVGLTAALDGLKIAFLSNPLFIAGTVIAGLVAFKFVIDKTVKTSEELIDKVKELKTETENLQTEYNNLSTRDDLVESEKNRLGLLKAQIEANKILIEQEMKKAYAVYQAEQKTKTTADDAYAARTGNKAPTPLTVDVDRSSVSDMLEAYEKLNNMKSTSVEQDDKIIAKKAELTGVLASAAEKLESYKKSGIELSESDKQFLEQIYSITNALSTQGNTTKETASATSDLSDELNNASEEIPTLADALSALSDDNKLMSDVKDEIKEIGTISTDTVQKILSTYPELESAIQDYLAGKISEKELIADMQNAYKTDYDNYRQMVISKKLLNEDFYQKVVNGLSDSVKEEASSYGISFSNFKNLQEAKLGIYQRFASEVAKVESLLSQNSQTSYEDALIRTSKFVSPLSNIVSGLDKSIDGSLNLKGYTPSASDLSSGKDKKKDGSGSSSSDDPWLDAFNSKKATLDHQLAMDEISEKTYYDKLEKLNNKYFKKHQKKYLSQYRQNQEDIYAGRKKIDEDRIKGIFDANENKYNLGKISEDAYYKKLNDLNEKYYKNNKDYADEYQSNLEKIYQHDQEKLKEAYQKKVDTIDKIIDKYSDLRDAINHTAEGQSGDAQIHTYIEGIKSANQEIKYLENEIDKLNKKKITSTFTQEDYDSQLSNLQSALSDARSAIDEFNQSISDSIKNSLDKLTNAYEDNYDNTTKALNKQKEDYSDIIDAQKEILQLKKDQADYEETIAEKTKDISSIENRIADLQKAANSDDREANAELQKLNEDLADKKKDLSDTQSDHEYDLANDALDKAVDDNNKILDNKLDALQTEYETQKKNQEELYNQLITLTSKASQYTVEEYGKAIDSIVGKLSDNGITLDGTTVDNLKTAQAKSSTASSVLSVLSRANGDGKGSSDLNQYVKSQGYKQLSYANMAELASIFGINGVTANSIKTDTVTKNIILQKLKEILGKSTFSVGGLANSVGEDGWGLIKRDELIFDQNGTKIFTQQVAPMMKNFVDRFNIIKPDLNNIVTNSKSVSPIIQFNLNGGTITPDAVNQFNKWKSDIVNDVSASILNAGRQYR
jgi:TP901 family phage tail tape measure protein